MAQTQINFDCEEILKERFESSIKAAGFSTMAEAFRSFMRNIVDINSLPSKGNSIQKSDCACQQELKK